VTATRKTWVLCYDVTDDRRRTKLYRYLLSKGHPVQRSVFELLATEDELDEILVGATRTAHFDESQDMLRCYPLGVEGWVVRTRGVGPALLDEDAPLVF
jgi:CRISPR-associated protein Cas2